MHAHGDAQSNEWVSTPERESIESHRVALTHSAAFHHNDKNASTMSATPNDRTIADTPSQRADADNTVLERAARIAEIRRQIAAGEYDTPERIEAALEAFLDSEDAVSDDARPAPRHVPR